MCAPAAAVAAIASAAGATVGGISAIKQGAAQRKAAREAERRARGAKDAQRRAMTEERMNQPDTAGFLKRAKEMSTGGLAGTFLTGSKGVNPDAVKGFLGSSSLLGGGS
jgi:hypothetical protein